MKYILSDFPINKNNGLALLEECAILHDEKDIILSDTTNLTLNEIIREHKYADTLRAHNLLPAKKLLFCGPSGCGKTLAAEVIANSISMPLVMVRLDSVISSFPGETIANLRKIFDYIEQQQVIVLFNEFDTFTKDRGDNTDYFELKRFVNIILQMMDNYHGESVIIATTNYETLLDKYVRRHFDEIVRFEMPNTEQIKRFIAIKLSGIRRNSDTNDTQIASLFKNLILLNGMSYADIERVLHRAVKEMILSKSEFLEKTI